MLFAWPKTTDFKPLQGYLKINPQSLDHFLTNTQEHVLQSGIIEVGLSDHQLIFITRKKKHYKYKGYIEILKLGL